MKPIAWEYAEKSFQIESNAIKNALRAIDPDNFAKAVDKIAGAERVGTSGCGHSGIACMHFSHSLCCIEIPSRFISPAEANHGATGFIKENDVMVLASRGGKTSELFPILNIAKEKGATVISITENLQSPLALDSDIVIKMQVGPENDKYNSQGTSSFVVLSSIFDALQVALLEEKDFKNERFALIHPGGAVGERLNKKNNYI
jgi:D-arabinose 5-phosphate isomerase GutQ